MKIFRYVFINLLFLLSTVCLAQNNYIGETNYRMEVSGSATNGENTPFWMVSNKYGLVPIDANNGYMRIGVFHRQKIGKRLNWKAGADIVAGMPRYKNVYIHQLYVGLYNSVFDLTIGSRENYTSLWDRNLTSGDMVHSANARPIPEICLSVPHFTVVPYTNGRLQFKASLSVGRSFDTGYLEHFVTDTAVQKYTKNVLWHDKSLYIRFSDTQGDFPLYAIVGLHHSVQWGGTSTSPKIGKQPQRFSDFMRIFVGKAGDTNASLSDQNNVLGNQYGSYDMKIGYNGNSFNINVYKQHYFDDNSGTEWYNYQDGLYGLQVGINNLPWLNNILVEFLNTRNQSGPLHYILYDHDKYPGYGGGSDNYYNNSGYPTGVSYFNRSVGTPLLTSPEYNANGKLGFKNNRIKAWHLGCEGYISQQVAYRLLLTATQNWGTMPAPFLKQKDNFSIDAKITYCHPRLDGWTFSCEMANDSGSMYGDNFGISLSVTKFGILSKIF